MINLLEEVSNWKLDAKQENSERYFYHTHFVDKLISGVKSFVIGRKGSGKTAISEYLEGQKAYNVFTKKLTFKNFPFNELYSLENSKYASPNQYITLWKYLIYTTIAKLMMINQNIDIELRNKLLNIYGEDPEVSLSRSIKRWVSGKIDLKLLGTGVGVSGNQEFIDNNTSWIEKVEILEDLIYKYIDNSTYLIVFDELDEDYTNILEAEKYKEYTNLLTGLFKAVQDIKSIFVSQNLKINPVVFLRDDIYSIIQDPDKTKWSDLLIWIEWSKVEIQNLIAFRISKAINPEGEILNFSSAWQSLFFNEQVQIGMRQQKGITQFEYISRNTMMRPRDFVKFMQLCADETVKKNGRFIRSKIIKYSSRPFSNYLRSELEDEIHSLIPDISKVLDVFSHIRKQEISTDIFKTIYMEQYKQNIVHNNDVDFILKVLFNFSIIGNQPKQKNTQIFKYQNKDATLNFKEHIVVHRGLFKSLQIV